jgi:ureidoacrylate peracid hydrolase
MTTPPPYPSSTDALDPDRCALVVVDMQNDYCHVEGALARLGADVSPAADTAAGIRRLAAGAAEAGVPRIYLRTEHSHWFDTEAWLARGRGSGGDRVDPQRVPVCAAGSWGCELFELEPDPEALVITKFRYSGFAYTPLELALRAKQRDTIVLCGTATEVCVEATATDALFRGFHPVIVEEGVFTGDAKGQADRRHLRKLASFIGTVERLEFVLQRWSRAGVPAVETTG